MSSTSRQSILVSGAAYSGKTFVAKAFQERGYRAIDADDIEALGEWKDAHGNVVPFIQNASPEWFIEHDYYWNAETLAAVIKKMHAEPPQADSPVFIFGFAGNLFTPEILQLFDRHFYLHTTQQLMKSRLADPDGRTNPFGRTKEQQEMMLTYLDEFQSKFREHNFISLDASSSPDASLVRILTSEHMLH